MYCHSDRSAYRWVESVLSFTYYGRMAVLSFLPTMEVWHGLTIPERTGLSLGERGGTFL